MPALQPFSAAYYDTSRVPDAASRLDPPDRWLAAARQRSSGATDGAEAAGVPAHHVSLLYRDWAGTQLSQWLAQGVLAGDGQPTLYVYRQQRPIPPAWRADPRTPVAAAFTGLLAAVEVGSGACLWLAETVDPAEVEAVAGVVRAFAYDLAPAWAIYPGDGAGQQANQLLQQAVQGPPHLELTGGDGAVHQLWRLDADACQQALESFGPLPAAVVAGTAQVAALRARANGQAPAERNGSLLMLLTPSQGADLAPAVLPVHRVLLAGSGWSEAAVVERVSRFFRLLEPSPPEAVARTLKPPPEQLTPLQAALVEVGNLHTEFNGFVMYTAGGRIRLVRSKGRMFMENWTHPLGRAAWRSMDVSILHALLLERALGIPVATSRLSRPPVAAEPDAERAIQRVEKGEAVAAFLLPAPSLGQILQAALDNNPLPAGAVRLWPQPPAGLLFRRRR